MDIEGVPGVARGLSRIRSNWDETIRWFRRSEGRASDFVPEGMDRAIPMKSFLDACHMPEPLQLAVEAEDAREGGVRLLHQPFALIGRDQRADVPLDHRLVSRRHVYIQVVEGHVFWVDLESRLGTVGSGRPRKYGWLDFDEMMRIGPYTIRRLVDERSVHDAKIHHPLPEAVPLVARSYGPSSWPDVSLEFLNGPSRTAVWPMNRVMSLVGSAGGCKFRLADPSVSPFHCSLLRTSAGLWIVDLLGSDGVAVNNALVRYALLADGDLIKIGRYRIRVRSRFAETHPQSNQTGGRADSGRRTPGRLLSLRESGTVVTTKFSDDVGSPSAPAKREQALSPLSFRPPIARTELLPPAEAGPYPPGGERAEVEASVLVPLVNQFGMMQQQMLDQFQNAMGMLVEMFGSLQREQMDQIRQELDQMREVTRELQDVKLELAAYKRERAEASAAVAATEPPPFSEGCAVKKPLDEPSTNRKTEQAATEAALVAAVATSRSSPETRSIETPSITPSAAPAKAEDVAAGDASAAATPITTEGGPRKRPGEATGAEKDRDVMLWLNQRIVTLQTERETRWQKILKLLPGAS